MLQTIDVDDLESLTHNPLLFHQIDRARLTPELCEIAVTHNAYAIIWVPRKFLSKKLCTIAVTHNGFVINRIPKRWLTQEFCDLAVMENSTVFPLLERRFRTPALCRFALEQDVRIWRYVPKHLQIPELKARIGTVIAKSVYNLYRRPNELYQAGCRRNLTLQQALTHWGPPRRDRRAQVFYKALLKEKETQR